MWFFFFFFSLIFAPDEWNLCQRTSVSSALACIIKCSLFSRSHQALPSPSSASSESSITGLSVLNCLGSPYLMCFPPLCLDFCCHSLSGLSLYSLSSLICLIPAYSLKRSAPVSPCLRTQACLPNNSPPRFPTAFSLYCIYHFTYYFKRKTSVCFLFSPCSTPSECELGNWNFVIYLSANRWEIFI